jgi:hypothetical protein
MSNDIDFLALYQELGLSPERCSLDQLKQAYRRRVALLHPDRNCASAAGSTSESIQHLNTLYGAAIAFERRFGRLPGADPAGARRNSVATPPSGHSAVSLSNLRREPVFTAPEPKSLRKRVLLALLILLALAWALWGWGTIAQ